MILHFKNNDMQTVAVLLSKFGRRTQSIREKESLGTLTGLELIEADLTKGALIRLNPKLLK
jgi:hypothetical protein